MLLLEGYTKQIYLDRASAARGGPAWAIRVTNDRGRQVTFLARSWQLRASQGSMRACGGLDDMLIPGGPSHWVETSMAIDADIAEPLAAARAWDEANRENPAAPPGYDPPSD